MNLKRLREEIDDAAGIVESLGTAETRAAADEIRALGHILVGPDDLPAERALQALEDLLSGEKRSLREAYVEKLTRTGTDKSAFDPVHAELDKDKRILKDDADAIAHLYTFGREKWPSRKAAVEAIRKKFVERAYQESKMRIVERSKVW